MTSEALETIGTVAVALPPVHSSMRCEEVDLRFQSDPDLAGIFGTNLFSAEGAATAVREAGLEGKVKIVGFDAGPKQVQDLKSGIVDVLIGQHPYDIGHKAVTMAVDYLNTKQAPTEKVVTTGYTVVTRDNVDTDEVKRYLYVADCADIPAASPEASPAASPSA